MSRRADRPEALSARQQRFVEEYLVDLNGKQAAIRAGYSARTAEQQASRLLSNVKVAEAVERGKAALAVKVQVTQEDVLAELKRIGFSDMRSFVEWGADGVTLKESGALPDDAARCVAEVSETRSKKGGSIRFKLHDKVTALVQLGRHIGMFKEREEREVPVLVVGDTADLKKLLGAMAGG